MLDQPCSYAETVSSRLTLPEGFKRRDVCLSMLEVNDIARLVLGDVDRRRARRVGTVADELVDLLLAAGVNIMHRGANVAGLGDLFKKRKSISRRAP